MIITVGIRRRRTFPALAAHGDRVGDPRRRVCSGRRRGAFVNPSALLTQAYRGVGMFKKPLPVRIVASYPSWDRLVFAVHPRSGIRSLADIKSKRYPLRVSVREDPTHSTLVLIDQVFALHGFTLKDIESWGGRLVTCGGPSDKRRPRTDGARRDRRGLRRRHQVWLNEALAAGPCRSNSAKTSSRTGQARLAPRAVCRRRAFQAWPRTSTHRLLRLADLLQRLAARSDGLRHLRGARRARSRDSVREGRPRFGPHHGARDRHVAAWTCRCIPALSAGCASIAKRSAFTGGTAPCAPIFQFFKPRTFRARASERRCAFANRAHRSPDIARDQAH